MICSRCGTSNAKTSKFCRECGKRLMVESVELVVGQAEDLQQPPDDSAVAELLYETLKLYERGKLDLAFAKCKEALGLNPNSPSGHSLLGLIYEKKAEEQAARGNREDAEDYLRAAVRQIERVLEANPDSTADREKLASLHAILEGQAEIVPKKRPPVVDIVKDRVSRIPLPWLAATVTVLVFFCGYLVIAALATKRPPAPPTKQSIDALQPQATQGNQQWQGGQQPQAQSTYPGGLSGPVWSYQPESEQQAQNPPEPAPPQDVQPPPQERNRYGPPNALGRIPELPSMAPYPVENPPAAREEPGGAAQKPEPQARVTPEPKPAPPQTPPSDRARAAYTKGDYTSAAQLYEQAIVQGEATPENHQSLAMSLYNLGRKSNAVDHFNQAVQLYLARKAQGIDVEGADAGIRTCKLYIDMARE